MIPNTHPETKIRYGAISGNNLDPDVFQELFYGPQAKDLSYEAALKELRNEAEREADAYEEEVMIAIAETDHGMLGSDRYVERKIEDMWSEKGYDDREDYVEAVVERRLDGLQIEEPTIEGEYEGVKYSISWLGGAPIVFLLESPEVGLFDLCSPCCPGAVSLPEINPDGYLGYTVPDSWRHEED